MKLKEGVIVTQNGDETIVVAAGEAAQYFNGMIKMNSTASFITESLKNETTVDALVAALCEKYAVDEEEARASVISVVESLEKVNLLDK